jgi:hypothetical protein
VNGTSDQLFASTRLSENENAGVRRSHEFHLLEHLFESGAVANDFFEPAMFLLLFHAIGCCDGCHIRLLYWLTLA